MSRQAGPLVGVYNGSSKKVGLGKFLPDLKISETFVTGFEVLFFASRRFEVCKSPSRISQSHKVSIPLLADIPVRAKAKAKAG